MGHQKLLISLAIIFAFLVCAINFSVLVKRTNESSSKSVDNGGMPPQNPLVMSNSTNRAEIGNIRIENVEVDNATTSRHSEIFQLASLVAKDKSEPIFEQRTSWSDNCEKIVAHEHGHWHHYNTHSEIVGILNDKSMHQMYFPEEIMWLGGQNQPEDFGKCVRANKYLMYNSILGHQCGCGVRGFMPSHSEWIYNATTAPSLPAPNASTESSPIQDYYYAISPTLRLARELARTESTLCFSGDSIDYQIYTAMHNNLRRIDQLHDLYHPSGEREKLVNVVSREIPVTDKYHTKPGNMDDWFARGHRPPNGKLV